jgi:hypothetical protein
MKPFSIASVILAVSFLLAVPAHATERGGHGHARKAKSAVRENGKSKMKTFVKGTTDEHGQHRRGHYAKE